MDKARRTRVWLRSESWNQDMPLFLGLLERMNSDWTQWERSGENKELLSQTIHSIYTEKAARNETRKAAQVEELLPLCSYQQFSGMEEDSKEPTSEMQGLARGSTSYWVLSASLCHSCHRPGQNTVYLTSKPLSYQSSLWCQTDVSK